MLRVSQRHTNGARAHKSSPSCVVWEKMQLELEHTFDLVSGSTSHMALEAIAGNGVL